MTKEELVQRIHAHRRSRQPFELLIIVPMVVVWLVGSWMIMEEVILADRPFETKSDILLGLMLLTLLVEGVVVWTAWRKPILRAHGLLCPKCDSRIQSIWNPQKVLKTGKCHHCGHSLLDAKS